MVGTDKLGIEPVEVLLVDIDIDRLSLIHKNLKDATIGAILGIELKTADSLASQGIGLKDLHLVLDTYRIRKGTRLGDIGKHLADSAAATTIILLHQHLGGSPINRSGVTKINKGSADEDYQREKEPLPVENHHGIDVLETKH